MDNSILRTQLWLHYCTRRSHTSLDRPVLTAEKLGASPSSMERAVGTRLSHAGPLNSSGRLHAPTTRCRPLRAPRIHSVMRNVAGGARHAAQNEPKPLGKQPPRPPELPGLMHSVSMTSYLAIKGSVEQLLLEWRKQYGPFFEFQIPGSPPVMVVCDPEAIKEVYEVLQYHKSPRYADLLPVLGTQSMVTSEGHVWRSQRDAFNPGFSSSFLKAALPGFISCTEHLVQRLQAAAGKGEVVLMHHLTVLTTLEVICKVGFGEDIDFLSAGREGRLWSAFEGLGRHVAWFLDNVPLNWMKDLPWNKSKTVRLQEQLDSQLMDILLKRLKDMGISVQQQQQQQRAGRSSSGTGAAGTKKCPIPGVGAAVSADSTFSSSSSSSSSGCPFQEATAEYSSSGGSAQEATAANPAAAAAAAAASAAATEQMMVDSKDILTLAVKLCQREGSVDLEMLLSQMKTFFAAGHDTTASLIGWTMWYLCLNPEVECKLAAEILAVMGDDRQPSYQQMTEMRYLNAVLKESLRIRPPVGLLARWAPEGTTLAGYDTSNKVLLVSPYVQHIDTDAWGPDAEEFRPERWLDVDGIAQNVGPYSYMPFSRGPRDCIGSRFALLEAKTILAMVLRDFEFEYAGKQPEEVMMSVTAHPKFGVPLRVKSRPRNTNSSSSSSSNGRSSGSVRNAAVATAR